MGTKASHSVVKLWYSLLLLYANYCLVQCTDPVSTKCPQAVEAALALTANNAQLPVTNAVFSGQCDGITDKRGMYLVTDFGDTHFLATKMPAGAVILSNGDANIGTTLVNTRIDYSVIQGGVVGTDPDLNALSAATGYTQTLKDQVMLTFDITPTASGNLAFQYVFGSEEYPWYAPPNTAAYNDIFGFFIWSTGTPQNVALLPNSSSPVSISTVNPENDSFFLANFDLNANTKRATELNGVTTVLKTADYYVNAGTTYHIKLVIADGNDAGTDSVVWVKAGSVRFDIKDCAGSWVPNGNCSGACAGGSGFLPEIYKITVAAANGGNPCPVSHNATRFNTSCVNNNPCPVNCTGSWQVSGNCTGTCSGGSGFIPEAYIVTSAAMYGGSCPHNNGTVRNGSACTNNTPCPPRDCVGNWVANGNCTGACGGGPGMLPERYSITTTAAYGGTNCSFANGATQLVTPCNNTAPCPINCVGSWVVTGNCTGACIGVNGTQQETYIVTTPAQYGGVACNVTHGTTRSTLVCSSNDPCPVPCNYTWVQNGNCSGSCGGGTGTLPEKFIITSPALYGGGCPKANGTTRSSTPCTNNNDCPPRNCSGSFVNATCNGTCGGGAGWMNQTYKITITAKWGGANCSIANGTQQEVPCINNNCCPVPCNATWVRTGPCNGACSGGSGKWPEKYVIYRMHSCSGTPTCTHTNGTTQLTTSCINNTPCPPINCTGGWVAGACDGTCGGGAGLLLETYRITVAAAYNGTECPEVHGATRMIQACNNTNPCPVDCVGNWTVANSSNCTGACDGGAGFTPEKYIISQSAMYNGTACPVANNTMRYQIPCNNTTPCPPQNCVGGWVPNGDCMGGCNPGPNPPTAIRDAGRMPEIFIITTPALRNGTECQFEHETTRFESICTNYIQCNPQPCNASWVLYGPCNGTCGGGAGKRPERYIIYRDAIDGGTNCTHANKTIRWTLDCNNTTPCPVNCVGSWLPLSNGTCSGACGGGAGTFPESFNISIAAAHNGTQCAAVHGAIRNTMPCTNTQPCPVDCVGSWVPADINQCNGTCGGGAGFLPETYMVTTAVAHGGVPCNVADGTVRYVPCNNPKECPINCTGVWVDLGPETCSALCGGGEGNLTAMYNITQEAMYDGEPCPYVHGYTHPGSACTNNTPCAIDCVGHYARNGDCTGTCATNGVGVLPEVYVVTTVEDFGGKVCPAANGSTRAVVPCISTSPCPCVGQYVPDAPCTAMCSSTGILPERYFISKLATWGGRDCPLANGTTKFTTKCTNTTVCPWDDVVIVDSPPVLPPLNMSQLNESDIVIKGGNVTITGVKIEGVSGFTNSSVSTGSFGVVGSGNATSNSTTGKPLKPRVASFNGTLGFYTFGIVVEVLGEFELQRSMEWTWNTTWKAWVTQVAIRGTFVLTREEITNNVTTGIETMKPTVSGYLNLFSSIYPGPGFSGKYDWAGELELSPDPFIEWEDASSLLQHPTNAPVPADKKRRSLLQTSSTGMVPVQGRVAVRESKAPIDPDSAPGTVALDDGDIVLVCQDATCPTPSQLGQPENPSLTYPTDDAGTSKRLNVKLLVIILASVISPVGVALCATGIAAAVIYRRRRKKEEEEEAQKKEKRLKRLHKHKEGAVGGRQQQESSEGAASKLYQRPKPIWRSTDGTAPTDPVAMSAGNPWIASAGPAELERLSVGGSDSGSRQPSGEEVESNCRAAGRLGAVNADAVQRVRPGETGFGTMPGSSAAMATLPPSKDSGYGGRRHNNNEFVMPSNAVEHSEPSNMWQAAGRAVAGSLSGMASALARPFNRAPRPGQAYRVADPAAAVVSGPSFTTMFDQYSAPQGTTTQQAGTGMRAPPVLPGAMSRASLPGGAVMSTQHPAMASIPSAGSGGTSPKHKKGKKPHPKH